MRAYVISPSFEIVSEKDEKSCLALDLIVEIVLTCLRQDGDIFQYSVVWADPCRELGTTYQEDIAVPHLVEHKSDDSLRKWLRRSIDPYAGYGGAVRSVATCRAVTFGCDGQALLVLRHEDSHPSTSNTALAEVKECSDLLTDSDYWDGWCRVSD